MKNLEDHKILADMLVALDTALTAHEEAKDFGPGETIKAEAYALAVRSQLCRLAKAVRECKLLAKSL